MNSEFYLLKIICRVDLYLKICTISLLSILLQGELIRFIDVYFYSSNFRENLWSKLEEEKWQIDIFTIINPTHYKQYFLYFLACQNQRKQKATYLKWNFIKIKNFKCTHRFQLLKFSFYLKLIFLFIVSYDSYHFNIIKSLKYHVLTFHDFKFPEKIFCNDFIYAGHHSSIQQVSPLVTSFKVQNYFTPEKKSESFQNFSRSFKIKTLSIILTQYLF